jgi:hypothetical protein
MNSCGRPTSNSLRPKPHFASKKINSNVGPIWHHREDGVQARFLAFVLWKSLEMRQQRAGLGNSPRTILEELARSQSNDVVLPTATHGQIRLRCVTQTRPLKPRFPIASASSRPSACAFPDRRHRLSSTEQNTSAKM